MKDENAIHPPGLVQVTYDQVPDEIKLNVVWEVGYYSVQLLAVRNEATKNEEISLFGSGTFVELQGKPFILTAAHVIDCEEFTRSDAIGLNCHRDTNAFRVSTKSLVTVFDADRENETHGPDIGLISLVGLRMEQIEWIKARKNFWNIDKYSQIIPIEKYGNSGLWGVTGGPVERSLARPKVRLYKEVLSQHMGPWLTGEIEEFPSEAYDYIDIIYRGKPDSDWPKFFGGLSGGGLWQVPLSKDPNTGIIKMLHAPLLSGVPFYQDFREPDVTRIKCHGRNSIYKELTNLSQRIFNPK
ncbi:MAG: hypothetical protein A2W25_10710 [candidate division Zixibacteria bacterium RBG_16_53_22]|nr:MAG: hypothetical protein A2W25_10710 [candidate division Zixibacteria bacterium RBG_16_53_22]